MAADRNIEALIQEGNTYRENARLCEEKGDYIAAEAYYNICRNLFEPLASKEGPHRVPAQTAYMRTLFDSAMLPQTKNTDKQIYLSQAGKLAALLEQQTGDIEFMIAREGIQIELQELSKVLEQTKEYQLGK